MSDAKRKFSAVRKALGKLFPDAKGRQSKYLDVLAALVSGIVGSRSSHLPAIANQFPSKAKKESKVKRFSRWTQNENIEIECYFLPFAEALIAALSHLPLVLVIDGSSVGRGCMALVIGLVYKKRALPLAWIVVKAKKGHLPEDLHIELVKQLYPLIPKGAQVIFLGDGEFDGIGLQAVLDGWGWKYVCRTAKSIKLYWKGEVFYYQDMLECMEPGQDFEAPDVFFTEKQYGPVLAVGWWKKGEKEPLYLVSNMDCCEEACRWYAKRFIIETFFSDQKSRGFYLHKSHIDNPDRLRRLMIAACIAYYWIVYLGELALNQGWNKVFHRKHRCDLSLFRLGLELLDYFLLQGMPIIVGFGERLSQFETRV
jgi:hypothetical protein